VAVSESESENLQALIIVSCDGLGARFLGPYGNTWLETPAIDRLAAEGLSSTGPAINDDAADDTAMQSEAPAVDVPETSLAANELSSTSPAVETDEASDTMVESSEEAGGGTNASDDEMDAKMHVIEAGDTFWNLARRYYGDATQYTRLKDANPDYAARGLQIGKEMKIPQ